MTIRTHGREVFLNELQPQVPSPWSTVRLDAFTHHYALEYLKRERPRLISALAFEEARKRTMDDWMIWLVWGVIVGGLAYLVLWPLAKRLTALLGPASSSSIVG